jgi:protein SCO1/2
VIAALPLLLAAATLSPTANEIDLPPGAVDVVERLNEQVPRALTFYDSTGRSVELGRLLRGKPVVLALVYYRCPVLCGLLLGGLTRALQGLDWKLGSEYDVVTVTMDPSEPPPVAAEKRHGYLQSLGQPGSDGWTFLTARDGRSDEIDALSDAVGFRYAYVDGVRQFAHAAALVVLTPEGRVSRYLYGVEFQPKQLKLALFEAARGRVGTSLERVLLRCYRFDERSKRYQNFVTGYFRMGGVVMILLVGGLLGVLWRREFRSKVRT